MKVFITRNLENPTSAKYAEECAASCDAVGIKYQFNEGSWQKDYISLRKSVNVWYPKFFIPETSSLTIEQNLIHQRQANALHSQFLLYEECAKGDEPFAILHHDAIVKRDFTNIEVDVNDYSIYYLSCCVASRNDYTCPSDDFKFNEVAIYDGLNAAIVSPKYCREYLSYLKIYNKSNSWADFHKHIKEYVVDPYPVVCESKSGRISTISLNSVFNNAYLNKSFIQNIDSSLIKMYRQSVIDYYNADGIFEIYNYLKEAKKL